MEEEKKVLDYYFHKYGKENQSFCLGEFDDFKSIDVVEVRKGNLWAAQRIDKGWFDEVLFLEFYSSTAGEKNEELFEVQPLMYISGFSEPNREGRHTYFPNKGYIFYMNYDNMVAALDYCKKFFDMD